MNNEQLMELFEFFKKIDKEKLITRQTYITGGIVKKMMPNMPGTLH